MPFPALSPTGFARFAGFLACIAALVAPAVEARAAASATLYVATSGNDAWSGALAAPNAAKTDGPFASLERARDEIRNMKQSGGLPDGGVTVEILPGRYELAAPVELSAEDSGTAGAPIVYRARPGDLVRISGGQLISGWEPVSDPDLLSRLDPAARGQVYQIDLRAQGVTEFGNLGVDAGADLQFELARADCQAEYTMGCVAPSPDMKRPECLEVFFNDEPMPISRGPNDAPIKLAEALGSTVRDVRGHKSRVEGVFRYEGDYPRRWVGEKEVWLLGSWCRDWAEQRHKVESHDAEQRIIAVSKPYHHYGYHDGKWFYGLNLLPEIDRPGEWCLDRDAGMLYFWPPAPIDTARIEVSMSPGLVTMNDTSYVTLQGLLFEATRGTAVAIAGGEHCRVAGCILRNLGIHAVTVRGGREHAVIGCDMYGMGGGGVYLIGGDRKTLTPAGHVAENNHIHHYARWNRMYRPAIVFSGVGQRASHNLIHDAPHAALIFGGNDHLIEF
ncbi:MAG: hypothetical protein JXR94_16680, partial [Candidatus Hydrogenedentes bacterium]|nr:hypothetical protein [Candidatus Hydrogenedentota bacterium]